MRWRLLLAVFVTLTVCEALIVARVDTSTPTLETTGRPFHVDKVAAGTVFSQRIDTRANDLNEVRLKGEMSADDHPVVLRAQLVETELQGPAIRVVRTGRIEIPAGETTCCAFRFEPIRDSRWRSYRIDLTVEQLGNRQLSLWLVPDESGDRLTINGRRKHASLVFRTLAATGTGARRLTTGSRDLLFLVPLAVIYNAGLALLVSLLVTASDPRRA